MSDVMLFYYDLSSWRSALATSSRYWSRYATSQCQQHGTPFTIFFLSPGLQGKLQMESGSDFSPPDHCISSSWRTDRWAGGDG